MQFLGIKDRFEEDAVELSVAGRLDEAGRTCDDIVADQPHNAEALHLRGVIAFQQGKVGSALSFVEQALQHNPSAAAYHHTRGICLQHQQRFEEALAAYQEAVRINPRLAPAHLNRAVLLQREGRLEQALLGYEQALSLEPRYALAHSNRGAILHQLQRFEEAVAACDRALAYSPGLVQAHINRGAALEALGRLDEALGVFDEALNLKPDLAKIHFNRGNVLRLLGRLREAVAAYERALRLQPDYAAAHIGRATAFEQEGRLDEALAAFEQAARMAPESARAHLGRGIIMRQQDRREEALAAFERALQCEAGLREAHLQRAGVLRESGRFAAALAALDQALQIDPEFAAAHKHRANLLAQLGRHCEAAEASTAALRLKPEDAEAHSNYLFNLEYDPSQDDASRFAAHLEWGKRHGSPPDAYLTHDNTRDPEKTLRVGLVSRNLCLHPVGYMTLPLLVAADRAQLSFVCYSDRGQDNALTAQLKSLADGWRSTFGMSDRALAERVRQDDIDILIDLAGHTPYNRLPMFALKPAPIQVSWLDYRATTGLTAIDYVLSDPVMAPPGAERWFVERVARLPTTRLCYAPLAYAPRPSAPPMLARGWPTFGSFNNVTKISPKVFQVWARLLTALPEARLLLKWATFGEPETRAYYFRLLEDLRVETSRVELRGESPHPQMLAEYADVDIALDPFPFCGGVSSLEALWQGVPVVTLPQDHQASRQTQAFLTALGRTEWVAENEDDYVRIGVALVRDPQRLSCLRGEQRALMAKSPLCDGPSFARHFESALRTMWRNWCSEHQEDACVADDSLLTRCHDRYAQ